MQHDEVLKTLITAIAGIISGYLIYKGQIAVSQRNNKLGGQPKSQQEVAVDVMVYSYDQALKQKDEVIKSQNAIILEQVQELLEKDAIIKKLRST